MGRSRKSYSLLIIISVITGVAVWAALRFTAPKLWRHYATSSPPENTVNDSDPERWAKAVERIKEDRSQDTNANVALDVPSELRHYEDRHWFLATQVAEVKKQNIRNWQDFPDLAAALSGGQLVPVAAVTNDYVLFGVGAKATDEPFTRYQDDHNIELYDETQLRQAYQRLSDERGNTQQEIKRLQSQLSSLKGERSKQSALQKQISAQQQQLKSFDEEQALLDESYGQPDKQQKLFRDYEALQALAKSFRGRSYDLANPADRQALKVAMLSSLRPQALKTLEQIAKAYHEKFDRPLPVSSLVRPEEYQHTLRRFNRAAVLIDTPPHSTGLAFDIDYRYMSAAEQNFVMAELAGLKRDGRIEVLRERGANFHVFAFIDGTRPSDDLITASLEDASPALKEANHAAEKTEKPKPAPKKSKPTKPARGKAKAKRRR